MITLFKIISSIAGVFMILPIELSGDIRLGCALICAMGIFTSMILEDYKSDEINDLQKKINELEVKIDVLNKRDR